MTILSAVVMAFFALHRASGQAAGGATIASSVTTGPGSGRCLQVIPRRQEGFYSCWSTSSEMAMDFVGKARVRQCEQASPHGSAATACCDPNSELVINWDCDHPSLPDFERWNFTSDFRDGSPLSWDEIRQQINRGHPTAFSLLNSDETSSHMMLLIGYVEGPDQRDVILLNPNYPYEADVDQRSYDWYRCHGVLGSEHKHQYDYANIRIDSPQ